MPDTVTLHEAFAGAAGMLRRAGIETPELDARLLLCHAAALTQEAYVARGRETLCPEAAALLDQALARRIAREPVSRIIGTREFYGREFLVGAETLDPRPDTETLIEAALAFAGARGGHDRPLSLLDLGTGSGCILLTLLAELPEARGLGTDLSQAALALAVENAARLGVGNRASFLAADWLGAIDRRFDLVLSNPPYLATAEIDILADEVRLYDPRLALDGGADGLDAYRRIAADAPSVMADQARLLFEIGPHQAEAVAEILELAGLTVEATEYDLAGRPRLVVARN
ncbi:MAG TPA: peptide chain release factor N(5)-glutamine methyltransferase [Methyloceanibacter sp.]|nr:peptide chain release factor N(5)-glutamine methyltransferase [Methyloceanibacter sp.]